MCEIYTYWATLMKINYNAHLNKGAFYSTYDSDFVNLAQQGVEHAGIVKGNRTQHHIGSWVRALTQLHSRYSAEDLLNRVEFL